MFVCQDCKKEKSNKEIHHRVGDSDYFCKNCVKIKLEKIRNGPNSSKSTS